MKAILLTRPGSINERDRTNLLAEGVLVVDYREATEPKLLPLTGSSDIGEAVADLVAGLVARLPPGYRVRAEGQVVVDPPMVVLGGGGPPVISNGVEVPDVPVAGPYTYRNTSTTNRWLFIAAASDPLLSLSSNPNNVPAWNVTDQLPTTNATISAAINNTLGNNPVAGAFKLAHNQEVTISWDPQKSKPVLWTRLVSLAEESGPVSVSDLIQ